MKKNIKKILIVITLFISAMLFTNKVDAIEQIMGLNCKIDAAPYDDISFFENIGYDDDEFVGEQAVIKLTDNDGKAHWRAVTLDEDKADDTINSYLPIVGWIHGLNIFQLNEFYTEEENDSIIRKYGYSIDNTLDSGDCPKYIYVFEHFLGKVNYYLLGDKASPIDTATLQDYQYVAYSYTDKKGKEHKIIEAYLKDGTYAYIGPDLVKLFKDEVTAHQLSLIKNVGFKNFFNVNNSFGALLIAGNGLTGDYAQCEGKSEEWCIENRNFKVLLSNSTDGFFTLKKEILDWVDKEIDNGSLEGFMDIMNLTDDESFMNTLHSIKENLTKGEKYDFKNVNLKDFVNKLDNGVDALNKAYAVEFSDCGYTGANTKLKSSITACLVYSEKLGIKNIVDIAEKKSSENMLNQGHIISMIYDDVGKATEEAFKEKNYSVSILNSSDSLAEYTELMYTAIAYLRSRANELGLNKDEIGEIYDNYKSLVKNYGLDIYPVVDCETLLGDELIAKIKSYTDIIKIAIPIIVIGLGVMDFTRAIFAGEDDMKKAQKQFIKRLGIAVLIFLTPTLLNLLLSLANKVWVIISPDSCGIF